MREHQHGAITSHCKDEACRKAWRDYMRQYQRVRRLGQRIAAGIRIRRYYYLNPWDLPLSYDDSATRTA